MSIEVSVLLPVRNAAKYLALSIESILNQSIKNFELIILNDNSTDDTLKIINQYLAHDKRIILIDFTERMGISRMLNFGISIAKGDFIARMDGDDISEITRLESQIRYLKKYSDLAFIGCNVSYIDSFGKNKKVSPMKCLNYLDVLKNMPFKNVFFHPTLVFRSSILARHKYNFLYDGCEDYELIYRILLENKGENIGNSLLNYRISQDQVTARIDFKRDCLNLKIKFFYFFRLKYLIKNRIVFKYYYNIFKIIFLFALRWKYKLLFRK